MSLERPLETGNLADTPVEDTVLRRFVFNQGDLNAEIAAGSDGRTWGGDEVSLADTGGRVAYMNQAILRRPLTGPDDPLMAEIEGFFEIALAEGRPHTMLSVWPTPDLAERGWSLAGHPAFVVRGPCPVPPTRPAPGVVVRAVTDADDLAAAERVMVEGFPLAEADDEAPGALFPPALLRSGLLFRLGILDGTPVAAGGRYVGHGVVNLCLAATLPAARRRGVWEALVWARVGDAPGSPAVAYTSDYSRPGFERMGFVPTLRFTLWMRR